LPGVQLSTSPSTRTNILETTTIIQPQEDITQFRAEAARGSYRTEKPAIDPVVFPVVQLAAQTSVATTPTSVYSYFVDQPCSGGSRRAVPYHLFNAMVSNTDQVEHRQAYPGTSVAKHLEYRPYLDPEPVTNTCLSGCGDTSSYSKPSKSCQDLSLPVRMWMERSNVCHLGRN